MRAPSHKKILLHGVESGYYEVNVFRQDSRNGDMEYLIGRTPIREQGGVEEVKKTRPNRGFSLISAIATLHRGEVFFKILL